MKKQHKCKVCKEPVKQKKGPGRPKTTHGRCKKSPKKATKKKATKKKATKKKAEPTAEEIRKASAAWREMENIVEGGNMLAEAEQGWTPHMKARARATQKIIDAFKAKHGVDIWTYVWDLEDAEKEKTTKKKTTKKKIKKKLSWQEKYRRSKRCKLCGQTKEHVINNVCGTCAREHYGKVTSDSCERCGGFGLIPECPVCWDVASFRRNRNPFFRRNPPIGGRRPGGDPRPSEAKHCEYLITETELCGKVTREGKPFCPIHIGQNTYIQDLMERLAGKQYEESIAGAASHTEEVIQRLHPEWSEEEIEAEGPEGLEELEGYLEEHQIETSVTMEEILLFLKLHGGRSIERLAKEIHVSVGTVKSYVALLKKRSLVETRKNKRGAIIVRLLRKKRLHRHARNPWSPEEINWRGNGDTSDVSTPMFVLDGNSICMDMLLNELYNIQKGQRAIVIHKGNRYQITRYGYERGKFKVVLDDIFKFTPEDAIKFMLENKG